MVDVDECSLQTDGCFQRCINNVGSYTCDCHSGFTLNADGKSCSIGEFMEPILKRIDIFEVCYNGPIFKRMAMFKVFL